MVRSVRLALSVSALAAATALPLLVATPARADYNACVEFLEEQGYEGVQYEEGCAFGAEGDTERCRATLLEAGVVREVAYSACARAARSF